MLAAAKNYDLICLQMKNYLPQQDSLVKKATIGFIDNVKKIVSSRTPIKPNLDKFIPQIFNFRLIAINWIARQPNIDVLQFLDDALPTIKGLQNNPKLQLLAENILFALRCNNRVVKNIIGDGDNTTSEQLLKKLATAPFTTYEQFFGTLALCIPNDKDFQTFVDFSHASLYIEFILVAAILISEENISVSTQTVNELAYLIADAAQDYLAIASQIGLLPTKTKSMPTNNSIASAYLEDDLLLSNLDLSDFASNF